MKGMCRTSSRIFFDAQLIFFFTVFGEHFAYPGHSRGASKTRYVAAQKDLNLRANVHVSARMFKKNSSFAEV